MENKRISPKELLRKKIVVTPKSSLPIQPAAEPICQ